MTETSPSAVCSSRSRDAWRLPPSERHLVEQIEQALMALAEWQEAHCDEAYKARQSYGRRPSTDDAVALVRPAGAGAR